MKFYRLAYVILLACSCNSDHETDAKKHREIAGNKEVADYIKNFEGRGALADSSSLTPPEETLKNFKVASDLQINLVLSEPMVNQPVNINFDNRGRLWVVQYNQYPYPEGLKITKIDEHLRSQFDKKPSPPPSGIKGADKISFFEDTDGDGKLDKKTDAISGLNIATSVAFGRGNIWVLNPPYLLTYPDKNDDGLPDGDPVIHLDGFGLEDTHATANSLTWGPDGWLYGAQGSTTTATINSAVTKNVHFKGQAVWRYHPVTKVFEIFAEGGGNTFHIEIDSKGRIYSGDNGVSRGQYYKQGAYYTKNLGKHGLHTNPYAFGFLPNMKLVGEEIRFTHGFIKYEGSALPDRYNGRMIAMNPLQNYIQLTHFEFNGSTFTTVDEERIVNTDDRWFRPVDIKAGPDGAVYIADWSDSRLTHIDPRDNWHRQSGRIYAIRGKDQQLTNQKIDIGKAGNDELISLLRHKNKWFRQQALLEIGNRQDTTMITKLKPLLNSDDSQLALEALWAIHLSGGFTDEVSIAALKHRDPFVRMWSVRLIGDNGNPSTKVTEQLIGLARHEPHAEVRSQLAATAKRLEGKTAVTIAETLIRRDVDAGDRDIPLQVWWALESKAVQERDRITGMLQNRGIWKSTLLQNTILERLIKRYFIEGGTENENICATLLKLAPNAQSGKNLVKGLKEALAGLDTVTLPPAISNALMRFESHYPIEIIGMRLRQSDKDAMLKAISMIGDKKIPTNQKVELVRILGEVSNPQVVPALLQNIEDRNTDKILRKEALIALQRFDDKKITNSVVKLLRSTAEVDSDVKLAMLSLLISRKSSAIELLKKVEENRIGRQEIPAQVITQLTALKDADVNAIVAKIWPVKAGSSHDKTNYINKLSSTLRAGTGNAAEGRVIYNNTCGSCHKLFGEGGNFGPDLTGYDRNNVNDLLVNIVDPGAYIREGYVMHRVTTKDGRTISGLLKSRNATVTSIQQYSGNVINIPNADITDLEAEKTSLMPENLLNGLSEQRIRDLFTYLGKER